MSRGTVAFYARVSSDAQAREHTIDSQIAALKERIAADDHTLEPEHGYVDDGYSGTHLQRPELEKLRDAIATGCIDRVYVHAPDRLARSYVNQVLLMEEFRRAGVEVEFINRQIGKTPEDQLLLQIEGVIAEYERAKLLERVRRGRRHAARSGLVSALTAAPYGYRYVRRDQGDGVARFEVVEDKARVVRLIFAWVGRDRLSVREVCRRSTECLIIRPILDVRCLDAHASCRPIRNCDRAGATRGRYRARRGAFATCAKTGSRLRFRHWLIRPCSKPPRNSSLRTAIASANDNTVHAGCCRD